MCIDKLEYILEKLYENQIPVFEFNLHTNVLIYNDRIITEDNSDIVIINKYSNWIDLDKFNAKAAMNPTIIDDFIAKAEAKDYTQ